ncbi:MAG: copper amine oxidase N-terminal domain-containing protein [Moorella sp. (in: firmicutes)]
MKKKIVMLVVTILALALAGATAWAGSNSNVRVLVDGREIHPDVPAYINENNRTMIPYRAVSEALGATVDWNEADRSVTVWYEGRTVVVWIGKKHLYG